MILLTALASLVAGNITAPLKRDPKAASEKNSDFF